MIDRRRVQRTLFRMQHDAALAGRLFARDERAIAESALTSRELDLLLAAGPQAVAADPGGKRLAQFLRNVSSEHALSVAWAQAGADRELLASFPSSRRFHDAVMRDERLPLAFAAHALERAARSDDAVLLALARLEHAMASARRGPFARAGAPPGGLALAPRAEVLALPRGAIDAASAIRAALDAGEPAPRVGVDESSVEHALVLAGERPAHRLAEAGVELLSPLAGALLSLARDGADAPALAAFRERHDVTAEELAGFVASLADEGIVVAG